MNIHERLGGNNARRLSPRAREFYIDGVTYPSSASDIQSTGKVLYTGEFTKVSEFFLISLHFYIISNIVAGALHISEFKNNLEMP